MTKPATPTWAEAIQLVPILTLAFPFIVAGEVDLSSTASGFVVATALAVLCSIQVVRHGHHLNPILVGTDVWLALGAVAFGLDLGPLRGWLEQTQAFGLFAAVFGVGCFATLRLPGGFVAAPMADQAWVRRMSLRLVALAGVCVVWAWIFRHDIRLGGGLPFILLNVARRIMLRRAPPPSA